MNPIKHIYSFVEFLRNQFSIVFLSCLLANLPSFAQRPNIIFGQNNIEKDIIYEQIEDILIDSDGFNWLGTTTGLYKFDGYNLTTYTHTSKEKNSISEDFVTTLFEDSKGLIWIGTYNNGLNVYDKKHQAFYNFTNKLGDESTLSSNRIPRINHLIAEDKDGFIWVNTDNGLNKIDPKTKKVERHFGDLSGQIIYHKNSNDFWIGGQSLMHYNPVSKTAEKFIIPNVSDPITSIILGGEDLIWIGTNSGVFIFDISQKIFYPLGQYFKENKRINYDWAKNPVTGLYKDFKGNIWIGVAKSVHIVNERNGSIEELSFIDEGQNGLLDEDIGGIYGDHRGTILITYASRGITEIHSDGNNFRRITNVIHESVRKKEKLVRSVFKDKFDDLWVGTYSHGLSRISNSVDGKLTSYTHDPGDSKSLNSNFITAIYIDSGDRLWVGTFEDGFNYSDDIFKNEKLDFTSSEFDEKVEIHEFAEDIAGRIWMCTNEGFYIYDKDLEQITHYGDLENQDTVLKTINIQAMTQESANVFWLATWTGGVIKMTINSDTLLSSNNSKDSLSIYHEIRDEKGNTLDNRFINIHKDKKGDFWLASNNEGLVKMTIAASGPSFETFNESNGAPSNKVYAIVEDDQGFLWISTSNGIGKFDPTTNQFSNYYESDGILANSLIWDAYFQSDSGEIFFGGFNGITTFHPDSILEITPTLETYISKLSINHIDINVGDTVSNKFVLDKNIRFTETITLTHKESNFSLEFGALSASSHQDILFAYKLDGFDEEWIYTRKKNRIATYTNLNKGTYYFRVKATKKLGQWGDESSVLQIIVVPPWWKTTWAYLFYISVFILLLYLFQKELQNRAKLQHSLELVRYKYERDNELNKEKFKFFTTLSHELRSPLTLILGPLDRLIRKHETNSRVHQNLVLIQNQAQRLQKLTNQLMNFRKYEIENLKLKAAEGNFTGFLQEIIVAFRQHARMKQINFHLDSTDDEVNLYYDRDKFEIIIVNLLSNAFKFTPQNGTVKLSLTSTDVDQAIQMMKGEQGSHIAWQGEFLDTTKKVIQIEISDTGVGIHPDQLQHVFDRYFQASNIQSISIGGTGIGLEIAKNYVELHHGCIMVKSEENKGTTFYIWVPLGKSHLSEKDIIHDFKPSEHKDHYRKSANLIKGKYADTPSDEGIIEKDKSLPTLLIVDDNPDIIYFLQENFEGGFNIITAQNGRVGLQKAFEHMPEIIISDIMMPEVDGLELCKQIKTDIRTSHIPVILLTARISDIFQSEGLETGADDYITKPFDEKILNIRVKNLIDSRRKLRERYSKEITLMPRDITITQPDEKLLDKVIKVIEENIADNDLKVEWIAKEIGMSHSVLYKKVLALTDVTLVEFIRNIRLKKASILLKNSNASISEISHDVGFVDPKYFSKCFQKLFGLTPSSFVKENAVHE